MSSGAASVKKKAKNYIPALKAGLSNPAAGVEGVLEGLKDPVKLHKSVLGGQPLGEGAQRVEAEEMAKEERANAAEAAKMLSRQTSQGTSAIASANELSRTLASDPNAQIQGGVAAGDSRSGLFSSLAEGLERRRAQLLQSKRAPGRKSTILTR